MGREDGAIGSGTQSCLCTIFFEKSDLILSILIIVPLMNYKVTIEASGLKRRTINSPLSLSPSPL
jgi:hypothetical protein